MFCPSENFRQYCADLSKAISSAERETQVDENNWLRSWSNETYLWYDEIEDRDPACCSTPAYFQLMKTTATTSSGNPKDRFHFSQSTEEYRLSREGIAYGYGARFKVLESKPPRNIVVQRTEPSSPATAADVNLLRGTQILSIDGIDVVNSNNQDDINKINAALFRPDNGDTHTFMVKDPGTSSQQRSVTMTSREITVHPVQNVKVLTTSQGDRVGYMLFNSHIATSAQPLIDADKTLVEGDGIDDLVLDLRYNPGGALYIAQIIASIIAGSDDVGKTLATVEPNSKGNTINYRVTNSFRDENGDSQPLPDLDLSRLFVLTTSRTCSASELIINSLRGIDIDVIRIGSTTCGKYHAFVPQDNCGTTYFTIQYRVVNAKGDADYDDGFSPTYSVADNDYDHQLGDAGESLLATALAY